ncbi:MAG: AI-2E family transporter [bacterium]
MKEDLSNKTFTVHITTGTIFRAILVIIALIGLFYLKDLALIILASIILASAVEPFILFLMRLRLPRIPSAIGVYAVIISLFLGFFYFFVPTLLNETSSFLSTIPEYLNNTKFTNLSNTLSDSQKIVSNFSSGLNQTKSALENGVVVSGLATDNDTSAGDNPPLSASIREKFFASGSAIKDFANSFKGLADVLSGSLFDTLSIVFGGISSIILIFVLSFYLAAQEDGLENFLRLVTPLKNEEYILDLWRRSSKKIGLWMQGQLVLAAMVAILVYLGLMVLGVKNALLLAFVAGLFEIIPVFGPILSAIPSISFAFVDGGMGLALLVTGMYVIIQQFENHLIYPLVVRKIVGVPAILVIISMIMGWQLAGFIGLIIAVPVVTMIVEYMDDIQAYKNKAKKLIAESLQ